MRTRLSARGQVVIPKRARDELGWAEGLELDVEVFEDRVELRRRADAGDVRAWMRWEGVLAGTAALEELELEHRDEVEREERTFADSDRRSRS